LEGVDVAQTAKRAATFWLIGLVFSVITVLIDIYETTQEEAQLVSLKKAYSADEK
jgi:hypothetical protein